MHIEKVSFSQFNQFAFKDISYQLKSNKFKDFFQFEASLVGLQEAINSRKNFPVDRTLMHDVLFEHYQKVSPTNIQVENLTNLLKDNSFTIVTAHQPCILTGPAFYIYKILSTIRLTQELQKLLPQYNFIPIFINGSEDHDFDEIKSTYLFNKQITWNTNQKGPVGRYDIKELTELIYQFKDLAGENPNSIQLIEFINNALENSNDYNDFVFIFLNQLFGKYGLIILNMDDKRLKKSFAPIMKRELLERKSENLVLETQNSLQSFDFKPQAFPRDINLFYFINGGRERIYFEDKLFKINNTELSFNEIEILQELEEFPERFSPNVIMRPLFQEFILPNIAYIGGGGEIAYWLERKSQFAFFNVFYPCLIRRNSVFVVNKSVQKQMEKVKLNFIDFITDEHEIIREYINRFGVDTAEIVEERKNIKFALESLAIKASNIDQSLLPYVEAESVKLIKSIDHIEQRMLKSIKQREEIQINQIKNIKEKLFPSNGLQERKDNFLQYVISDGFVIFDTLLKQLNPLEKEVICLFL